MILSCVSALCFQEHYVKSVLIRSYSGPHSIQIWENMDQNNSEYRHFLRSGIISQMSSYLFPWFVANLISSNWKKSDVSIITDAQRFIQNPVKHLRWSFSSENSWLLEVAENFILNNWQGFEWVFDASNFAKIQVLNTHLFIA